MLRSREAVEPERFTFHSSRMRMKKVTKEELEAMDADSGRCATELVDARVDVLGYACLVAIMSMGKGYHRKSEAKLHDITVSEGHGVPVVTSAGALIAGAAKSPACNALTTAWDTPAFRAIGACCSHS